MVDEFGWYWMMIEGKVVVGVCIMIEVYFFWWVIGEFLDMFLGM